MPGVEIYTDGACRGNPGPGGYGVVLKHGETIKELSGACKYTTNNRMELLAVIKGLEALKRPCDVTLYSDSKYVVDAMNKGWVKKWQARGWVKGNDEPAKNSDMWKKILELCEHHNVTWVWVKGHADNKYNNRCDKMAVEAIDRATNQD